MPEFGGGRRLLDEAYEMSPTTDQSVTRLMFPGMRLLHAEPPVVGIDDFFTSDECDDYITRSLSPPPPPQQLAGQKGKGGGEGSGPHMQRSATLGADVDAVAQVGEKCSSFSFWRFRVHHGDNFLYLFC